MTRPARRSTILSGKKARFSPSYTLSVDASYEFDMGDRGRLIPGIYLYASDDYKTTNIEYFFTKQDAYTTVDLRATWYARDTAVIGAGLCAERDR